MRANCVFGVVSQVVVSGIVVSGIVASCLSGTARASIIVSYASENVAGGLPASAFLPGVTPLLLHRGDGLSQAGGSTFNSRDWSGGSLVESMMNDDYLEWGWSDSGPLNLDRLEIQYDRSGSGPAELAVLLQVNGESFFQTIFGDESVATDSEFHSIDLSAWQNVEQARFRLYGWLASRTSGTFDIENFHTDPDQAIVVWGDTPSAAVPEPATVSLWLGLAMFAVSMERRRRRKTVKLTGRE